MHRLQLQDPVQIEDYRYRDCSILYGKCPMGKTHRTDKYGGSLPNRARLPIEVAEAVAAVWAQPELDIESLHIFKDIQCRFPRRITYVCRA